MTSEDMPNRRVIWMDGEFVPWEDATVHVLSHSLQRGSLIFDYMSVGATPRGAAVFRMTEHVERFARSAELVGLPLARSRGEIEQAIVETVRRNPGARAVKVCAYLPSIEVDVVPLDSHVAVSIAAYDPERDVNAGKPRAPHHPRELRLWIEKEVRNRRKDIVPPQAKVAANYAACMAAKWKARKAGYDEILLIDEDGFVAEGPTTNVFHVDAAGRLVTPAEERVLLGVTRLSILEIARRDGLAVEETRVRPEELSGAVEVFLTGTSAGVWPVVSIDDQPVGEGKAGPVSLRLRQRFMQIHDGGDPDFESWLTYVNEA